jgi:hypothetical protein
MPLPKSYNYFPPSMPLSTSPSLPLGSIDIYPITKILVGVKVENLFGPFRDPGRRMEQEEERPCPCLSGG